MCSCFVLKQTIVVYTSCGGGKRKKEQPLMNINGIRDAEGSQVLNQLLSLPQRDNFVLQTSSFIGCRRVR